MDRYVYHQLRSGEQRVRLLNLSPGSNSDDIQCDILDYKINLEKPFGMYEALSYRWGNPSDSRRILVRDQADTAYQYLDVTANLHAALHHMRDPSLHRTLWIDAVCINQSDLEERGQQVQFMASVYARACQVVVWLGESPENERDLQESREAFELIRRVARNPVDIPSTMPKAVLNLLRKEWFTRIWVLQEIAAARSFSIMSGEEEIFGTTFVRGIQQLLPKVFESDPSLHTYITVTIELMALAPPSAYKHEPPALDIAPLGDLIEMFHTYGATDQRDKIYALLGLTSDHRLTHSLQPNYEKSWAKVLNELIEHLLGKHVESLTWDDKDSAVITASGCTVGYVLSVSEGMIQIESKDFYRYSEIFAWGSWPHAKTFTVQWASRQYSKAVKKGDVVCLLEGSAYPTIIRPCSDHFDVIVVTLSSTPQVNHPSSSPHFKPFPELVSMISKEWFSTREVVPRRKFLLLWDWQQLDSHSHQNHALLLAQVGCMDSIDSGKSVSGSDIPWSRRLLVRRVLDDVRKPEDLGHWEMPGKVPVCHDPHSKAHWYNLFHAVAFSEPRASHNWLKRYAYQVRYCIRQIREAVHLLESPSGQSDKPSRSGKLPVTDIAFNDWIYKLRTSYSILSLVDLRKSKRNELWSDSVDTIQCSKQPMYWDFGELQHIGLLHVLFPLYRRTLEILHDRHTRANTSSVLFNGRYVINLLLAQEQFKTSSIQVIVRRILDGSSIEHDPQCLLMQLAILSEACNNQLTIDADLIAQVPLTERGLTILAFLFGELWYDAIIVRQVIAKVFVRADNGLLGRSRPKFVHKTFMHYQRANIVTHLDDLNVEGETALLEDPIFRGLYEQMNVGANDQSLHLLSAAKRREEFGRVQAWFVGLRSLDA